jgi:hypothetical protein
MDPMYVHATAPLFAWDALEDSPSLKTLRRFLAGIPDDKLLESLRSRRGRGRNDYPAHVLWGVVLLTIALRHPGIEACLGELGRNKDLRALIGIESESGVPKPWNMSRFLEVLGSEPHRTLLREVFDAMVARLGAVVEDLGVHGAGDATALNARRTGSARGREQDAAQGLPEATGGRKEYTDDAGNVTKVVEWFGFKLHLVVDVKHEVALAYQVTDTKAGDGETLPGVLDEARRNLPGGRMQTLAFDKAADSDEVHKALHARGIKPVIQNRSLWKQDLERPLPGRENEVTNLVHDEGGAVYCYDTLSTPCVRHPMAYIGHEPGRGTLKYRCPARHQGWQCPSDGECNRGRAYGKTVRVKQELDLRRFPAIPRATKQFERRYKGRTAVERVNARLKLFWGADDGNITGSRRFHAFIGAVMVVHAAFATLLAATPRRFGPMGQIRLGPIQKALQEAMTP